jgi:PqqD family protein of HPr-rel-A system
MESEGSSAGPEAPGSDEGAGLSVPPDYVPRRHPDVLELDLEDGLILYNRDSSLVHHLNPSARIVWYLSDGTATVERLAHEIAEEYGLEWEPIRAQVAGLVAELDAVGLIEDAGGEAVGETRLPQGS